MSLTARRLRLLAGALAAGTAGILGVTAALGGPIASADPAGPVSGSPISPATVTQTVTVAAAPAAAQPAPAVVPAAVAAGVPGAAPAAVPAPAPAAEVPTIVPATTQTLAEFFAAHHVGMHAQKAADFKALNIVLPMPTGWTQIPDPNVPDAFAVLADRVGGDGLYSSNAAVVVYELTGDFDAKDAISHGFVDSQQLPVWRPTGASMADYGGMPSALVEGTYRQNDMTLNTARRHVIATSGSSRYLVSLSVTTSVSASVASGQATDGILNGFRVSVPGAAPAPAAAPAAPAAAGPAPAVPAAQPVAQPAAQPVSQPVAQPVSVAASSQLLGLPR